MVTEQVVGERRREAEEVEIRERLIPIIADESGVTPDKILDTSRLGEDLGIGNTIGSGEFLELKEKIEKQFKVVIPWEEFRGRKFLPPIRPRK